MERTMCLISGDAGLPFQAGLADHRFKGGYQLRLAAQACNFEPRHCPEVLAHSSRSGVEKLDTLNALSGGFGIHGDLRS